MLPRFFCPDLPEPGVSHVLPAAIAHHLDRVLRLRAGQKLVLFDGSGREFSATLLATGKTASVSLDAVEQVSRESPVAITLVQALATADKMDWVVQKAVELGVRSVQPVAAERSVLRLDGERAERRVEHWQQVAVSAAEQSGRNVITCIEPILPLARWLGEAAAEHRCWILDPEAGVPLSKQGAPEGPVALLIGPEGGWAERELAAAHSAGCLPLALGPRVLRTETAGLAAVAAIQALWGDF